MISKHDDLVGSLIHDVAHLLRLKIDRKLKKYNLTRVKWLALGVLRDDPSLTQSALAERLELGDAATGRLVDRLVQRGLVERESNEDDRRVWRLSLTGKAKALLARLETVSVDLRADILHDMPEEELVGLETGLQKIKANLRRLVAPVSIILLIQPNAKAYELSFEFLVIAPVA